MTSGIALLAKHIKMLSRKWRSINAQNSSFYISKDSPIRDSLSLVRGKLETWLISQSKDSI